MLEGGEGDHPMTTLSETMSKEITALQQKRMSCESRCTSPGGAQGALDKLETRCSSWKTKRKQISEASEESFHAVKVTTQKLVDEIRDGYQNIKKSI